MSIEKSQVNKDDSPLSMWFIGLYIPIMMTLVFGLLLFPISGWAWTWWEAWAVIGSIALNMTIGYSIINQKNPRVIRNRMKVKKTGITEKIKNSARSDWFILPLMLIGFLGMTLIPGYEYGKGWPWVIQINIIGEIIGLVIMNIGLVIFSISQVQNAYASKILDINEEQKLVDTGLYRHIRHPLYLGAILWILTMPFALGSWISILPALVAAASLILRIKFEEDMLIEGMEGYEDYRKHVKYKLIPGIY